MTRTLRSLGFFLLICVFSTAGAQTAQDSLLQNISLTWVEGMYPEICWLLPPMQKIEFDIKIKKNDGTQKENVEIDSKKSCTSMKIIMSGGFVQFFIGTPGTNTRNEPDVSYYDPDLVKTWECFIQSSNLVHCSWEPAPGAPSKLHFFYNLVPEIVNNADVTPVQECPSYTYTNEIRNGCNLKMTPDQSIRILFNGTVKDKPVRNTYRQTLLRAKLPRLKWKIIKTPNKFNISWTPPDVFKLSLWNFTIKYIRCNQPAETMSKVGVTFWALDRVPSCQYRLSIIAEAYERGGTIWSKEETFDADSNLSVLAAIIIPLVLAIVVVLTLVFCRKNKKSIFPKVPEPRDFLSDISENNNKISVGNLYCPAKEEEDCKITLVIDPQINKLDF